MDKLKIALLYRGQMRMYEEGAKWKEKLIERHKDEADFMAFGHTSILETIAYCDEGIDLSSVNFRHCRKLTEEEIQKRLQKFDIKGYRIFNSAHMYYQAQKVIDYWLKNKEFRHFLETVNDDNHFLRKFLINDYPQELFIIGQLYAQRDLYYSSQIEIGDFMSQYVSAGHSLQMLNYYMEHNDWVPDIIVSLRYDTAIDLHNIFQLYKAVNGTNMVLGNGVIIKKHTGRVNDLAFVMDYETAQDFLGDIDNRIHKLLTDWRVLTALSSFDPVAIPHSFWNFLIRHDTELVNSDLFKTAIFRPGITETTTVEDIDRYFRKWNANMHNTLIGLPDDMRHGVFKLDYALDMLNIDPKDIFN